MHNIDVTRCRATAKMTARCALYLGYSTIIFVHAYAHYFAGIRFWTNLSRSRSAHWWNEADRMLILNVANNGVACSTQRHVPSIRTPSSTSANLVCKVCTYCPLLRIFWFLQEWRFGRSRSSKVIDSGTNRKRVCDFLWSVIVTLILHCFRDIACFTVLLTPPLFHPNFKDFLIMRITYRSSLLTYLLCHLYNFIGRDLGVTIKLYIGHHHNVSMSE